MKNIFLIILAILVGFAALTLFTTIAQEVFFNGISYTNSPISNLIIGGSLSVLGAVLAGSTARYVFSPYRAIVPLIMSVLIMMDTAVLVIYDKTVDPAWFDILAGGSLIIGVWIGYNYTYIRKENSIRPS